MAWVLIFLLFLFLIFYISTQIVWVKIIKEKELKLEIHLPILAIHLIKSKDSGDNKKKDKKANVNPSLSGYLRITTDSINQLNNAKIEINRILLPISTEDFNKSAILRPLRQHILICSLIAYIRTKSKKFILEDNAIILSPDVDVIHLQLTLKLRLYQLIQGLLSIRRSICEERKRNIDERRNV